MLGLQETAKKHQLIAEEHLDIARKRLKIQHTVREQELSDRQKECLHLFRLTKSTEDATYEWYKDRVEGRVEGTCMWFLRHAHFLEWVKQDSGPLLVSADPGCGKSVLAKYLTDHVLPESATVCYFFFKDQDQNTVRQALCALLHQLFSQKPALIEHAMKQYDIDGKGLVNSTKSLWTILGDATQDSQAGSVIVVLDALDECAESEFEDLMRNIENQSRNSYLSHSKLRYLLTSRPYEQIVERFQRLLKSFPRIHIPGEEESGTISQEVNRVINYRVEQLAEEKGLANNIKADLADALLRIEHRTYLWVHLVFNYLKSEGFKETKKGIQSAMKSLPTSVNEAYEKILTKSKDQLTVRKTLAIILAADRPLTLLELNVAIEIDETTQSIQELDLETDEKFKSHLRSWCGLFVSVHHSKVYFLHQTAREFLLADSSLSASVPQEKQWQHSIVTQYAHRVLAECCMRFIRFFNSDADLSTDTTGQNSCDQSAHAFFAYCARHWPMHFRKAHIESSEDADISDLALQISDPDSRCFPKWMEEYDMFDYVESPKSHSQLTIASFFGLVTVVMSLLDKDADVNAEDERYGTALQAASGGGHEQVVKMLLDKDANINTQGGYYGTALQAASDGGYEQVVKMLLDKDANVNALGGYYGTALYAASIRGYEQVVKMLLDKDADVNVQGEYYGTALQAASDGGHEQVVKMLLDKDANVNAQGGYYGTALYAASGGGYEQVVKMLLDKDADVNAQGRDYGTALYAASARGHEQVVKMLLDKDANVNAQGGYYGTALYAASARGYEQVVKMLLDKGARQRQKDDLVSRPK
jgi:ankyrin repeat protein/Cdc6-like AAA superfamily ATPase